MARASVLSNVCSEKGPGRALLLVPIGTVVRVLAQAQALALVPHQSPEQYQAVQFSSPSVSVFSEAKAGL
jgi:hypothetical protein